MIKIIGRWIEQLIITIEIKLGEGIAKGETTFTKILGFRNG